MMGVGGSLDFIVGVQKRAPDWVRRVNLEWLYRLITQPWRWRRQLALPRFVWAVLRRNQVARRGQVAARTGLAVRACRWRSRDETRFDREIPLGSVLTLDEAIAWRAEQPGAVVFTNGHFDLLHVGHVRYLQAARARWAMRWSSGSTATPRARPASRAGRWCRRRSAPSCWPRWAASMWS